MTNREARAFRPDRREVQAAADDATRDLLTEPRWGKWEGVPDYEDGPATQLDARDTVLVLFVARPSRRAQVTVLCGLALVTLVVAWMLARGLGWAP